MNANRGTIVALAVTLFSLSRAAPAAAPRPHVLVVLVDDYGWNDIAVHAKDEANAAEILTPTFDSLISEGILLERHYVFRFCSPTRSALQTGRNPIHVSRVRVFVDVVAVAATQGEWVVVSDDLPLCQINVLNSDLAAANVSDPISGFAGLPRNVTTIAQKLASVGYSTAQAGKWHIGLATPDHTPHGRGYAKSLSYLDGANDYWTSVTGDWCGPSHSTDLWASTAPAYGLNNSFKCAQNNQRGCIYEDDLFTNFTLTTINAHDPTIPLFFYFAPHSVHLPLQVPMQQLNKFDFITGSDPRKSYAAMTNYVDAHVGQIVASLKAKGMWENTLLILSADNGGPIFGQGAGCMKCDGSAGANNYPLRGGKHSPFEGGIRANAFVSGGFLPPAVRGTTLQGFVGVEDWYTTLCALAGVDPTDERAAAAGLPPIDGVDMWPYLSGNVSTSPRTEVWVGSDSPKGGVAQATFVQGLITADGYKLVHDLAPMNIWTGPKYPNATTAADPWDNTPLDCGPPEAPTCLWNVLNDPTEHTNLAAAHPDIVARMAARIKVLQAGVFSPRRGGPSPLACKASESEWRGFVGPFLP